MMDLPTECFSTVSEFLDVYDALRPGCLLLDLRLPGGGDSLLKKQSARESRLSVIVITGHGDMETQKMVMKLGAIAFFEKPFDSRELCERIRQVMESTSGTTCPEPSCHGRVKTSHGWARTVPS